MTAIDHIELVPVSIPYRYREVSSQVNRGGVSDLVLKVKTSDGLTGWGECCSGADIYSVIAAAEAMKPLVLGRSPWELDAIRRDVYWKGLWQFRKGTANFTWAGFEMALLDIQGKAAKQPLYRLLGGKMRETVDYFYYLHHGTEESLAAQCQDGLANGFSVFYLKVGMDFQKELRMIQTIRGAIGENAKIRVDANTSWSLHQAKANLEKLQRYDIDFVEGPVVSDISAMRELMRSQRGIGICMNEGLWSREDALERITAQACDYITFSPYWVGSFFDFKWLSTAAAMHGITTCKHTHGEFSIAAFACHHALLNLPLIGVGHQQTAYIMMDDIAAQSPPIARQAAWGVPSGDGLGIEIDEDKLRHYNIKFSQDGPFLPYEDRG